MGIDTGMYVRLSVMMFLEFAVWGAWAPVLAAYLIDDLKFSGKQTGLIYAALPIACIISPFLGGQIADRYLATEYFLGIVHILGGICLVYAAYKRKFGPLFILMLIYSLLYSPTLALVNSLMFSHIPADAIDVVSPRIRVWGTIGWIIAGLLLSLLRNIKKSEIKKTFSDCLMIAGIMSIILGLYSFTLPHTPPPETPSNPLAFLEAISLMKEHYFLIFLLISFVVTTELQFYYIPTAPFLQDIGVANSYVPAVMTIAQVGEILGMAVFLPWAMKEIGIQWVLVIGVIAWPIRYVFFAMMKPLWLVVASLALHGIGYSFFFFAGQIFVDKVAPPDIRASAQALNTVVTLGLGNFIGTQFTGIIMDYFKDNEGKFRWRPIFVVPCVLTVLCAIAFLIFFHPPASIGGVAGN